jgi:serine protease
VIKNPVYLLTSLLAVIGTCLFAHNPAELRRVPDFGSRNARSLFVSHFLCLAVVVLVSGCGGGGGGGGDGSQLASLSGTITASANSAVDSDTNDPYAPFIENNTFDSAQGLYGKVQLSGYVTKTPTGDPLQAGDRFALTADPVDLYFVHLSAGQYVSLLSGDWDKDNPAAVNLDLDLYDSERRLVKWSHDSDADESVQVTEDGHYFIAVSATAGASKYQLNIGSLSLAGNHRAGNATNFVAGEVIVKYRSSLDVAGDPAGREVHSSKGMPHSRLVRSLEMSASHQDRSRAVLLKWPNAGSTLERRQKLAAQSTIRPYHSQLHPDSIDHWQTLQLIDQLRVDPKVEFAEPNYIRKILRAPNDAYFTRQWHYPLINLPQAWNITTGSASVIVAVIDTGVWLAHEDLSAKLVAGYDFVRDPDNALDNDGIDSNPDDPGDGNGPPGSSSWHGTHVAGIIAAHTNNGIGVAGAGWNTRVMPLRALGRDYGDSYDVIQAIRFAAGLDNDSGTKPVAVADIINLSLGGEGSSSIELQAIHEARAAGVIIIAAAGNERTSTPGYPASYEGVISVSAVDARGQFSSSYSNYGEFVDIAAPGGDLGADIDGDGNGDGILSALVDDGGVVSGSSSYSSTYAFYEGTSMAAPHVAGVIALMKAVYPAMTPDDLDRLLITGQMSSDKGSAGRDDFYGYGMIDALKAVVSAENEATGKGKTVIYSDPNRLDFASQQREKTLLINKVGEDPLAIQSVTASAVWLSVSALGIDVEGVGSYQVAVDRKGLADGIYNANISFHLSDGSAAVVPVSLQVGVSEGTADAGFIYVLLLDAQSDERVQQDQMSAANGRYGYHFNDVEPGKYRIVAGSDIDNDLLICGSAESCGAYPTLSNPAILDVSGSRSVLDSDNQGGSHSGSQSDLNFVVGFSASSIRSQAVPGSVSADETLPSQPRLWRRELLMQAIGEHEVRKRVNTVDE